MFKFTCSCTCMEQSQGLLYASWLCRLCRLCITHMVIAPHVAVHRLGVTRTQLAGIIHSRPPVTVGCLSPAGSWNKLVWYQCMHVAHCLTMYMCLYCAYICWLLLGSHTLWLWLRCIMVYSSIQQVQLCTCTQLRSMLSTMIMHWCKAFPALICRAQTYHMAECRAHLVSYGLGNWLMKQSTPYLQENHVLTSYWGNDYGSNKCFQLQLC